MEIERKNSKKGSFRDLTVGDVFLDEDNNVMMVVDEDYGLGEGRYTVDGYAVSLASGFHYAFKNNDEATKIEAKVVIL